MDRNEIITELYNSKEFNDTIRKMNPQHLQDDLKSEVMLILCEKDEEEIQSIYESGGLKYYTVRIILNLIQSNTSPFYKKFRKNSLDGCYIHRPLLDDPENGVIQIAEVQENAFGVSSSPDMELIDFQERILAEKKEALREMEICNSFWYDRELIWMYIKFGNYRDIEAQTNIAFESAYKSIRKAIKKIDNVVTIRLSKEQPYEQDEFLEYLKNADSTLSIEKLKNMIECFKDSYPIDLIDDLSRRMFIRIADFKTSVDKLKVA